MQLSVAKDIFGSPWHISAHGIQQYFPVVMGMLNGASINKEDEPAENIPFNISVTPQMWSHPEEDIEDDTTGDEPQNEKVVHVMPVRGIMMKHDMACGPRGTRTLGNRLLNADADSSVVGHVLIIEGPGGSANAVPELAEAIAGCKKPVLGYVDGMAASAHQYVLSYCTEKWANRATDIVGSIGTMLMFSGRTQKSEEDLFKVREVTIYADDAFEKNEEYETAINKFEFKLAKERILNPHNEQFQKDIKANCPGVEDKHLHGRTFAAAEVLGALIDTIGSFDNAVKRVVELSGYKKEKKASTPGGAGQAANEYLPIKTEMKQFKNVNAALDVESLEAVDQDVSLNEAQLELLDVALAVPGELQQQLETANGTIGERDATIAELTGQVNTASATIAERDTTIENLNQQIKVLKGKPADAGAQAHRSNNAVKTGEPKAISDKYENPFEALDEISKEYLGKPINK
jgi:protease-4